MVLVVTYQIKSDTLRTRLNKTLKNFGKPVQNSVFEFRLDYKQIKMLYEKLDFFEKQLTGNDAIRSYALCEKCTKSIKIYGKAKLTEEPLYYIV